MRKLRLLALAASSALLFAAGLPNEVFKYGLPFLGYVALVPLYFCLMEAPSYGFAALAAGLYGAVHHASSSYWLFFFHDYALWTLGSTTLAYGIVYAVAGLYMAFILKRSGSFRPLAFALFWTCLEYLKSTGFLGYPWGLLPHTQTLFLPILQIADVTGVYGLSFLLALSNGVVAELILLGFGRRAGAGAPVADGRARLLRTAQAPVARNYGVAAGATLRNTAFAAALLALALGYGAFHLLSPMPIDHSVTAVMVQQNSEPWRTDESEAIGNSIALARKAMAEGGRKPDIILFSESTFQRPFEDFLPWFERHPAQDPFLPFVRSTGSYLFTGAPIITDWEKGTGTNSVILISPEGRQVGDYAKVHPVPFAEAIPFWEYRPFREFIQNVVGLESGWEMGTTYKLFSLPTETGTLRFGAPICFEDAFPDVCRRFFLEGADVLINLTNDAWSRTDSAEIQHFAVARFRAIEARKTLVRSTNAGVSCVVNAEGRVIARLPLFEAASMETAIPVYRGSGPTFYVRFGDVFAWSCLLLFLAWFLILWTGDLPRRRKEHEHRILDPVTPLH
jgi:apolipoprotein N-acyltransferase